MAAVNESAEPSARTVAELRPKPGIVVTPTSSVADAAKAMAKARQDACLVLGADTLGDDAELKGILTDTDVVRKVLAMGLDANAVTVSDVMTIEPICVLDTTPVSDALHTMLSRRCRHLPVVDNQGHVKGLLDTAKLLFDAMAMAKERHGAKRTLEQVVAGRLATSGAIASQRLMQAAVLMSERKSTAVLVIGTEGQVVGIVTPKDLLFRGVAAELPAETATLEQVMTARPDTMPMSATVLQALHLLSTGGYRTVPYCNASGTPEGVIDVLALLEAALLDPADEASPTEATAASEAKPASTPDAPGGEGRLASPPALAAVVVGAVCVLGLALVIAKTGRR